MRRPLWNWKDFPGHLSQWKGKFFGGGRGELRRGLPRRRRFVEAMEVEVLSGPVVVHDKIFEVRRVTLLFLR